MNDEIAAAFIAKARSLLSADYLPKIERCLERLSDEDIWWRARSSANSIGNLLLHLEGNARQWLISGVGGAPDRRERDAEFAAPVKPAGKELFAQLAATVAEADRALAATEHTRLLEQRRIQGHDVTVLAAIFHAVEHFSMHTGQIILLTKMRTGDDLKFYDFSAGAPRPRWQR